MYMLFFLYKFIKLNFLYKSYYNYTVISKYKKNSLKIDFWIYFL